VEKGLSTTEIGERYGRSRSTVWRWLQALNIERPRSAAALAILATSERPRREQLVALFVEKRWSPEKIGAHYGRSKTTVYRWLQDLEIKRPRSSWALTVSKAYLAGLYGQLGTMERVAGHEQVTVGQVERAMDHHQIERRHPPWPSESKATERPPTAEQRRLYLDLEWSERTMAVHYGCSTRTIHEWLSAPDVDIPRRPPGRPSVRPSPSTYPHRRRISP
jgi:IS30 family transposase